MRENLIVKKITTQFICGGMEYKVQCECEIEGTFIMAYTVLKVWAMGAKNKYVRIYPYDLQLWSESMDIDISKSLQEGNGYAENGEIR